MVTHEHTDRLGKTLSDISSADSACAESTELTVQGEPDRLELT